MTVLSPVIPTKRAKLSLSVIPTKHAKLSLSVIPTEGAKLSLSVIPTEGAKRASGGISPGNTVVQTPEAAAPVFPGGVPRSYSSPMNG